MTDDCKFCNPAYAVLAFGLVEDLAYTSLSINGFNVHSISQMMFPVIKLEVVCVERSIAKGIFSRWRMKISVVSSHNWK